MHRFTLVIAALMFNVPTVCHANALAEAEHQVQREFRFFRIQIYNSFRTARVEYDARRQAGEAALTAWKQAGGGLEGAHSLAQWYRDAKSASLPDARQPLPPLPEFKTPVPESTLEPEPIASGRNPFDPPEERRPAQPKDKIYRVQEVATRSTRNPHIPSAVAHQQERQIVRKERPKTSVWTSLSRVFSRAISNQEAASEAETQP